MAEKTSIGHKSIKHDIIDKNNAKTLIAVSVATFVVVFCGFAFKSLLSQSFYHGRVVAEKEKALRSLEDNKSSLDELKLSFKSFVAEPDNILGGDPEGEGALDGQNDKLVLDALPSKYDYPALSSSFEKILKDGAYDINSIGGSDNASLQDADLISDGEPIPMPYAFSFNATPQRTEDLLRTLERSIRPMYIDSIQIQSGGSTLKVNVSLHTYFTHETTYKLGSKGVK